MDIPLDRHAHVARHRHTRSCFWDHRLAGWVCPDRGLAPAPSRSPAGRTTRV